MIAIRKARVLSGYGMEMASADVSLPCEPWETPLPAPAPEPEPVRVVWTVGQVSRVTKTRVRRAAVCRMRNDGLMPAEISRRLGVPREMVCNDFQRMVRAQNPLQCSADAIGGPLVAGNGEAWRAEVAHSGRPLGNGESAMLAERAKELMTK